MTSLYELNAELQKKYEKSLEFHNDKAFVRYYKRFFELLSTGHNEYASLFSAFEVGVESWMNQALQYKPDTTLTLDSYRNGCNISLSREEYCMYLNFLENVILPELKEPPDNAKLMITTYHGGTHLAYYRGKQYEVPMANGSTRIEDAVVIHWILYEEKYNDFTGG